MSLLLALLSLLFAPNGVGVVGGGLAGGKAEAPDPGRPGQITALAVEPGGKRALIGDARGGVFLREPGAEAPRLLTRLDGAVLGLVWGPAEAWAGSEAGALVRFVPGSDPTPVGRCPSGVRDLTLDPSGQLLASAGGDGAIRLWGPAGELGSLTGHEGPVEAVRFAGELLWSAGWDGTLRSWKLAGNKGRQRLRLEAGPREASGLATCAQRELAASACWDGSLRLWDTSVRQPAGRPLPAREHGEWVRSPDFSPDGSLLAAAAPAESAVVIWDLERQQQRLLPLARPPAVVRFVDAETLLVGGFEGDLVELPVTPREGAAR